VEQEQGSGAADGCRLARPSGHQLWHRDFFYLVASPLDLFCIEKYSPLWRKIWRKRRKVCFEKRTEGGLNENGKEK
jgi:hypothetical protein